MHYKYFAIPAILSATLCFSGCNKTVEPATPISAPQPKGLTNSLIRFVPSNTPLLIASTQNFDVNSGINGAAVSPLIKALNTEFSDMQQRLARRIQEKQDMNNVDVQDRALLHQFVQSLDSVVSLYSDYKTHYAEWGLDPNGYNDFVTYIGPHNDFVYKLAIKDPNAFKAKVESINPINILLKNEKYAEEVHEQLEITNADIQGESWVIYNFSIGLCDDENLVKDSGKPYAYYCKLENQAPATTDQQEEDEDQVTSENQDPSKRKLTYLAIATNYKDNVFTVVPMWNLSTLDNINDHLKPSTSPITSEQYAGLQDDVMVLAYMHNLDMSNIIFHSELISTYRNAQPPERIAKLEDNFKKTSETIAKFPTFQAYLRMNNSEIIQDLILNVKDLEFHKEVNDIVLSTPAMDKQSIFGFRIGANLEKMSLLIADKFKEMGEDEAASDYYEIASYAQGLYGLNIDIKTLEIQKQKKNSFFDVDGRLIVYGPATNNLISLIYVLAKASDYLPEMNQARTWGLFDVLELYHELPNINEYMTQDSFTLATNSYDIEVAPEMSPNTNIIEFHITRRVIDILYPLLQERFMEKAMPYCTILGYDADSDECQALPKRFLSLFKENAELNMSIGIDRDGFRFTQSIDLHYNDSETK